MAELDNQPPLLDPSIKTGLEYHQQLTDATALELMGQHRPRDPKILQLEMYTLNDYEVYKFPTKTEFTDYQELEQYLMRELKYDVAATSLVMTYLHNFRIINVDTSVRPVDITVVLGVRNRNPLDGIFG